MANGTCWRTAGSSTSSVPRPPGTLQRLEQEQLVPTARSSPIDLGSRATPDQPRPRSAILRAPTTTRSSRPGNLSYVVNGGFALFPDDGVVLAGQPQDLRLRPDAAQLGRRQGLLRRPSAVTPKLGVMFIGIAPRATTALGLSRRPPAASSTGPARPCCSAENTLAGYSAGTRRHRQHRRRTGPARCRSSAPSSARTTSATPARATATGVGNLGIDLAPAAGAQTDGTGWHYANNAVGAGENINFGTNLTDEGSSPFANSGHPTASTP